MEQSILPVPEYYRDYLRKKEQQIDNIEQGIQRGIHFLFMTDYHAKYNDSLTPVLVNHLRNHTKVNYPPLKP